MPDENTTRNQHYVSQAEQRLNALNPLAEACNQRIYRFTVKDRENIVLPPESAESVRISRNLAFNDLFSFDVDGSLRSNLEARFQSYEGAIKQHSLSLTQKLAAGQRDDLNADLFGLFLCKFLSFLRNPHCVAKVLNSVGPLPNYHLTAAQHASAQTALSDGRKPHRDWLCATFGISIDTYDRWLRALFLLLTPAQHGEPNLLEQTVKALFENQFVMAFVYNYVGAHSAETCLLSDRGHTISLQTPDDLSMDFNICRSAFARFVFCNIDAHVPVGTPPAHVEALKRDRRMTLRYAENDIDALKKYNCNTAYQCAKVVYSANRVVRV